MKQLKNERGLTLVELLAVIVILAIIAAIAAVAIGNVIQNSKDKAILSDAVAAVEGAKIAHMDGECDANGECNKDVLKKFTDKELPKDTVVKVDVDDNTGETTYSIKMEDQKAGFPAIKNTEKYGVGAGANKDGKGLVKYEELLQVLNGTPKDGTPKPDKP